MPVTLELEGGRTRPPPHPRDQPNHEAVNIKAHGWIWVEPDSKANPPKQPKLVTTVLCQFNHLVLAGGDGYEEKVVSAENFYFWHLKNANARLRSIVEKEEMDGSVQENEQGELTVTANAEWE